MNNYNFPFGQKVTKVQQTETTPNKEVFVLGVYASAVHAKWLDEDNKVIVQALVVWSEPEIFNKISSVEKLTGRRVFGVAEKWDRSGDY